MQETLQSRQEQLESLIDGLGFRLSWTSILAARVEAANPSEKQAMLAELAPTRVVADLLAGLSVTDVGLLYEYGLAYVDQDARKLAGQFFTPEDVADFMVDLSSDFADGIWLDPCCGVGNLIDALTKSRSSPATFLRDNVQLIDQDALALLTASILLTIKYAAESSDVFTGLRSHSTQGDALKAEIPSVDYVIMNPPYVRTSANRDFASAEARDLYAYFLEKFSELASGLVAITPLSWTSASKFAMLRRILLEGDHNLDIYCFDNVPDTIFRGYKHGSRNTNRANSTRVAITVARFDKTGMKRITPLLRWRVKEREELLANARHFLAPLRADGAGILKIEPELIGFYDSIAGVERLSAHISHDTTPWVLQVPATPRYFLTATIRPLIRGQALYLYFDSEIERSHAYVLLNSTIAYWWWRIRDGGITLTRRTLLSTPWITTSFPLPLTSQLQDSEEKNLVSKLNAGRINENVKHPEVLIDTLNTALVGSTARVLRRVHNNTSLPINPQETVVKRQMHFASHFDGVWIGSSAPIGERMPTS